MIVMAMPVIVGGMGLLRLTDDFRHSVIVLREAKNVKYGAFMEPGRQLSVVVELIERGDGIASFKGKGEADGQTTVSARLTLAEYNLRDRNPAWQDTDEHLVRHLRETATVLQREPGEQ